MDMLDEGAAPRLHHAYDKEPPRRLPCRDPDSGAPHDHEVKHAPRGQVKGDLAGGSAGESLANAIID
jgi:hypothetical protein